MTVIEDRPKSGVEGDVEPITAEVLFAEARAHARRRRTRLVAVIASVVAAAVAVSGGVLWFGHIPPPRAPAARSQAIPLTTAGVPTQFVAWDAPTKQRTGGIEVISSTSGKTIRTLVRNTNAKPFYNARANPLSYVVDGFDLTNDGRVLYFNANNQIESVKTTGGAVSKIALGEHPMVSPNGKLLAYRQAALAQMPDFLQFGRGASFVVRQIATGQVTKFTMPGVQPNQAVLASWLPDSRHLLVYASKFPLCYGPMPCTLYPNGYPGWRDIAQVLDVRTGKFTAAAPGVISALHGANTQPDISLHDAELVGPATRTNEVRISAVVTTRSLTKPPTQYTKVGTLDVTTGRVAWRYRTPPGFELVYTAQIADQSSRNQYMLYLASTSRAGLFTWSPSRKKSPQQVGSKPRGLNVDPFL